MQLASKSDTRVLLDEIEATKEWKLDNGRREDAVSGRAFEYMKSGFTIASHSGQPHATVA